MLTVISLPPRWPHQSMEMTLERAASHIKVTHPPSLLTVCDIFSLIFHERDFADSRCLTLNLWIINRTIFLLHLGYEAFNFT